MQDLILGFCYKPGEYMHIPGWAAKSQDGQNSRLAINFVAASLSIDWAVLQPAIALMSAVVTDSSVTASEPDKAATVPEPVAAPASSWETQE